MLSVSLARLHLARPSNRALNAANSRLRACSSVAKTNETADSQRSSPRPVNILGDAEGLTEEEIEAKRKIARMGRRMYTRKLKGEYFAEHEYEFSVKQLRKDFVAFGAASGINPGVCWPTKKEIDDLQYIEAEFYPTFQQMKEQMEAEQKAEAEQRDAREREIEENLVKLVQWRKEMLDKEEKKRQEEQIKKAEMDERIREVREYIGYNVEPSDPKFIEVMEMKQAERREAIKKAKKQAQKEKMMQRLMQVNVPETAPTPETEKGSGETGKQDSVSDKANADTTEKGQEK